MPTRGQEESDSPLGSVGVFLCSPLLDFLVCCGFRHLVLSVVVEVVRRVDQGWVRVAMAGVVAKVRRTEAGWEWKHRQTRWTRRVQVSRRIVCVEGAVRYVEVEESVFEREWFEWSGTVAMNYDGYDGRRPWRRRSAEARCPSIGMVGSGVEGVWLPGMRWDRLIDAALCGGG